MRLKHSIQLNGHWLRVAGKILNLQRRIFVLLPNSRYHVTKRPYVWAKWKSQKETPQQKVLGRLISIPFGTCVLKIKPTLKWTLTLPFILNELSGNWKRVNRNRSKLPENEAVFIFLLLPFCWDHSMAVHFTNAVCWCDVGGQMLAKEITCGCDILVDPFASLMSNMVVSVQHLALPNRSCKVHGGGLGQAEVCSSSLHFYAFINSLIYYVNDLGLTQCNLYIYFKKTSQFTFNRNMPAW